MESLKISVDLKRRTNEVLSLQQGYTYPVELSIFDNGIAYTCTGATAQVHFLKSTGKFSIKTTDITISDNKVSFKLDNALINRGGVGQLQVVLTKDGDVFGSWAIHCNVFANVIQDESTEDSNIIDVLGDLTKNIAKADPLSKALEKQIPQATPLTNSLKTQIPQATELVNEMKSAIEEGGTVDRRELGEFTKGYTGKEYDNLDHRINGDIDHVQQQINDSSLLPYEGTSIKADNTYYGLTKDTVIKGKTLQNILKSYRFKHYNEQLSDKLTLLGNVEQSNQKEFRIREINLTYKLKPNTTYTILITVHELETNTNTLGNYYVDDTGKTIYGFARIEGVGTHIKKFTTNENGAKMIAYYIGNTDVKAVISNPILLEGDHTNTPIEELPFIEGIKSTGENEKTEDGRCKISGKSCGKNLAKELAEENYVKEGAGNISYTDGKAILTDTSDWASCRLFSKYTIPVKKDTIYYSSVVSDVGNVNGRLIKALDSNGNVINVNGSVLASLNGINFSPVEFNSTYNAFVGEANKFYFKFSEQVKKVKIGFRPTTSQGDKPCTFSELTFIEGTSNLTYEPYQESTYSYILDRPLMQLPNGVADSINFETGVLTRRVGKVVLDGSENWSIYDDSLTNTIRFILVMDNLRKGYPYDLIMCDKFVSKYDESNLDSEAIWRGNSISAIYIVISRTKLQSQDLDGFKQWLQANPTTVYYELAEPTTEQLEPTQLKSFEGTTHIMSNNTLQAHASVKIPSNVQMVVQTLRAENKALNVELKDTKEELINTDLDILEMNWETDFRVCELEYAIYGQVAKTTELENNIRAISKYEQAKTLILADRYNKATMTKQLEVYFDRGYISEKEYQELIELMN